MSTENSREEDLARLREIERELDRTDIWENPPYRNARRKLNRERKRIRRRLEGEDPNWFSKGAGENKGDLRKMKCEVLAMIAKIGG